MLPCRKGDVKMPISPGMERGRMPSMLMDGAAQDMKSAIHRTAMMPRMIFSGCGLPLCISR